MIINCGKRRIVSYTYGWKLEIERVKKSGEKYWAEDSPAYPSNLEQALEMVFERELKDSPDVGIHQLPEALKNAAAAVRKYAEMARKAAQTEISLKNIQQE